MNQGHFNLMRGINVFTIFSKFKIFLGGGVDDELIEVVSMTISEAEEMLKSKGPLTSPPSFLFGLTWFIVNKAPKLRNL